MTISFGNLETFIIIVLSAVTMILLGWLIHLAVAFRSHKKWHKDLIRAMEKNELTDVVTGSLNQIDSLERGIKEAQNICDTRAVKATKSIQRVGLVRFDAFDDVGGELSFSTALLNDNGDGLVVSAINGREQARCYAKPVTGGKSKHTLSDEEQEAIESALDMSSRLRVAERERA